MFAGLPPSSSELTERKALFRHLLLQIGGANIENPTPSSSLAKERTPPLSPPPCAGARLPTLAACGAILTRRGRQRRIPERDPRDEDCAAVLDE
jgi:hypothetical protein